VDALSQSPYTGQQYVYSWLGQWWEVSATFPCGDRTLNSQLVAILTALGGRSGTFFFGPYGSEAVPLGVATGLPVVNGANQDNSATLTTDGWTANVTGILKAGDFLQVGTGTSARLYRVLQDANSDAGGNATLSLFPRVRPGTADNSPITTINPVGVFRLNGDLIYTLQAGGVYQELSLTAIEAL
jgi:hypothetical protein